MMKNDFMTRPLAFAWLFALFVCCVNFGIYGQSQNAIGAHRVYQKTSFSCAGRPAGYYADIETGCQVYHMCDGLGRQFSYSCPNTTLFQQRMLICDHWYMVNCSRAESDYAANLLIGQRDKPFVNDEENNLRTPRPDLLDRPYAPDYSGESFRNQYKQLPAIQNQIHDNNARKTADKTAPDTQPLAAGQQRWKIPPPSRTILPPAYEPQIADDSTTSVPATRNQQVNGVRFVATPTAPSSNFRGSFSINKASSRATPPTPTSTTTTRRPKTTFTPSHFSGFNNAALHQRQRESVHSDHSDDLGTSHSTRYNTSADFNSAEDAAGKANNNRKTFSSGASGKLSVVKEPSKIYEPPFLYPIYNENDTTIYTTHTPLRGSTAAPFTARPSIRTTASTTTTTRSPGRPTTVAGKPFAAVAFTTTTTTTTPPSPTNTGRSQNGLLQPSRRFDADKFSKDTRTPTPAQGFQAPTPQPTVKPFKTPVTVESSPFDYKVPSGANRFSLPSESNKVETPSKDLLPPLAEFVLHDVATTQGPPIYYEWKVPSNGLEPPKLDPPIGVDGREYPETVIDYNTVSASGNFVPSGDDDLKKTTSAITSPNAFISKASSRNEASTTRTPTSRSIKDTAQPNRIGSPVVSGKPRNYTSTSTSTSGSGSGGASDILQLRKDLSVPEYSFPLENIGRTGYLSADAYNSFQLKIPERRSGTVEHLHWFGENPKCPECHPSYVVPGTCEPCLKR